MNLGLLLLGLLLLALVARLAYWWSVQTAARVWYDRQAYDRADFRGKPWYVVRYDVYWSKRPRRRG